MRKFISKRIIKSAIFLLIAIFLAFLGFKGFLNGPKGLVRDIFSPMQKFFYQAGKKSADYAGAIFSLGNIVNQNQFLTEQVTKLQADLVKMQEMERENNALKEQLNLSPAEKFNSVLADITGYDPVNFGQYAFIDKGESDGLKIGQPVVTAGGIILGKISEISPSTAKVQLLQDSNSAINVISQETRSTGILKGSGSNDLLMDMIPQDSNIKTGEIVITSGLGGTLPKGLLVGGIEKIISSDIEVFKKAQIKLSMNIANLSVVLVIIGK